MKVRLRKTIQNTGIMGIFSNTVYLYSFADKIIYKTINFDQIIWENHDIVGRIIRNGESKIVCRQENDAVFLDDITGEFLFREDYRIYDAHLDTPLKNNYIFGYKNSVYEKGAFYSDIGYFDLSTDKFVMLREQYEGNRIIWISSEHILFLKRNSIEYLDHNFNKKWDLSFEEMKSEEVFSCFDYDSFLFVIGDKGKLLKIDKVSGYIVDTFQHPSAGNFTGNYFVRENGQLIFLGLYLYLEFSLDSLEVQKEINFAQENIFVKSCFLDKENDHIYFYGVYGDSFPDLIGGFDINTTSFFWKYIMKSEGKGNRFFNSPVPVGNFIVVRDGLKNLYVFEKGDNSVE